MSNILNLLRNIKQHESTSDKNNTLLIGLHSLNHIEPYMLQRFYRLSQHYFLSKVATNLQTCSKAGLRENSRINDSIEEHWNMMPTMTAFHIVRTG